MKLLMLHAKQFWYRPYTDLADTKSDNIDDTIVAFVHVEENDISRDEVIDKAVGKF